MLLLLSSPRSRARAKTLTLPSVGLQPYLALATDPRTNSAYVGGRDVQFYVLPANSSGGSPVGVVWVRAEPPASCGPAG